MRKRAHQIKFRLSDDELMLLRRKLRESNLSMAEYFRRLLVDGEIKIYPNAFVADLQKQVKGVGRNVNQITRLAHISGKVSLETLRQISAAQEKIERQLERLNEWRFCKFMLTRLAERTAVKQKQQLKHSCSSCCSSEGGISFSGPK